MTSLQSSHGLGSISGLATYGPDVSTEMFPCFTKMSLILETNTTTLIGFGFSETRPS